MPIKIREHSRRINGEYAILPGVGVRFCEVTCTDRGGVTHTARVHAESVFEAAARGLRAIREAGALEDGWPEFITVEIQTTTAHRIPYARLRQWLDRASSPRERALQKDLR